MNLLIFIQLCFGAFLMLHANGSEIIFYYGLSQVVIYSIITIFLFRDAWDLYSEEKSLRK